MVAILEISEFHLKRDGLDRNSFAVYEKRRSIP